MQHFADKVALITGASSGIGRATALRLAGYGAKVGLAARSVDALDELASEIEQRGSAALAVPTDVTDAEQCRRAVEATVERFGRLDILICSAGLSMRGYFEDSDLEAFERIVRINFFGTVYPTYHAIPHVKRTRGSLVAISSVTGKRGIPAYSAYGSSKFAVQGLYETLRQELKRDGVHVGVVSPGYIATPILTKVLRPDGVPWENPPPLATRALPVDACVDCIIKLLVKRRREAVLPRATGLAFLLDRFFGSWVVDRILERRFPAEKYRIKPASSANVEQR